MAKYRATTVSLDDFIGRQLDEIGWGYTLRELPAGTITLSGYFDTEESILEIVANVQAEDWRKVARTLDAAGGTAYTRLTSEGKAGELTVSAHGIESRLWPTGFGLYTPHVNHATRLSRRLARARGRQTNADA